MCLYNHMNIFDDRLQQQSSGSLVSANVSPMGWN
jgi:hypothetical protein